MFAGSYCGPAPDLAEIASRWNFDPVLLAVLAAAITLALRTGNRLAAAGVALLFVAFVSPLCAASVALFSARSVHHLLLIAAALAVSLVKGDRLPGCRTDLPWSVGLATIAMTAVFWGWHVPALYDAALANMAVYWLMQITIFASSFAFWLAIRRANIVTAVGGLIVGMVQMGLLGAILTFANRPLYAVHAIAAPSWGLSPTADQQIAGLIMWVGGMVPFALGGAMIAMHAWQRQAETDASPVSGKNLA